MSQINDGVYVPCPYCGQVQFSNLQTEEERLQDAISKCDCAEAKNCKAKALYINNAKSNLREVFKIDFFGNEEQEISPKLEAIRERIASFFEDMIDGNISAMTFKVDEIGKVALTVNGDGEIKIKRSVSSSIERKVAK